MSMTSNLKALYEAFDDNGITYAYNVFPTDDTAPAFPYVTAFVRSGEGFMADDENYVDRMNISVLLFTKTKDPTIEDLVRATLKSLELGYTWEETYSADEQIYVISYSIQMEC